MKWFVHAHSRHIAFHCVLKDTGPPPIHYDTCTENALLRTIVAFELEYKWRRSINTMVCACTLKAYSISMCFERYQVTPYSLR